GRSDAPIGIARTGIVAGPSHVSHRLRVGVCDAVDFTAATNGLQPLLFTRGIDQTKESIRRACLLVQGIFTNDGPLVGGIGRVVVRGDEDLSNGTRSTALRCHQLYQPSTFGLDCDSGFCLIPLDGRVETTRGNFWGEQEESC